MKPITYDDMLRVRVTKEFLAKYTAATPDVASRVRYVLERDLAERIRKRAKAPARLLP